MRTSTKGTIVMALMAIALMWLVMLIMGNMKHTEKVLSEEIVSSQEYQVAGTQSKSVMMPMSTIIAGKTTVQMQPTIVYYTTLKLDNKKYTASSYEVYDWAQENETVQLDIRLSEGKEYICFKDVIVTLEQEQ